MCFEGTKIFKSQVLELMASTEDTTCVSISSAKVPSSSS